MILEEARRVVQRFEEIERKLGDPSAHQSPEYLAWLKERGRLLGTVNKYRTWESVQRQSDEARKLLAESAGDPGMAAMAKEELTRLETQRREVERELEELILADEGPTPTGMILEIRPGTGGDEAALFAGDLYRMYTKYAAKKGWKTEIIYLADTDLKGVKQVIFRVEGPDAYRCLRFEGGTHRVQRVPQTEASGRIHTSAATVAVLPEVEETQVQVRREDLKIDTFSAGGPGGQHVNKTESAVRIVHVPTGIEVKCQTERSQHRNRDLAMRWLRARLFEYEEEKRAKEIADLRRAQVGSGDRSEKIRTYNFPQSRITDHRVGVHVHNLPVVLDGDLDEIVDALIADERKRRLEARHGKK